MYPGSTGPETTSVAWDLTFHYITNWGISEANKLA